MDNELPPRFTVEKPISIENKAGQAAGFMSEMGQSILCEKKIINQFAA
ncbi:MAG: hypothetical protein ACREFE_00410 [Limisphaerales bacterium]